MVIEPIYLYLDDDNNAYFCVDNKLGAHFMVKLIVLVTCNLILHRVLVASHVVSF